MNNTIGWIPVFPDKKKATDKTVAFKIWWPLPDLNWGPSDYESPALTTELRGRMREIIR